MKCFEDCNQNRKKCQFKDCRYWIDNLNSFNCCLIAAKKEDFTLEKIGKIFNITRMRICQIEKKAISKIREKLINS